MARVLIDTGLTDQDVMEELARTSVYPEICTVEGCDKLHEAKGLCASHYYRKRRTGNVDPDIPLGELAHARGVCTVLTCDRPHQAKGLCRAHYGRLLHGIGGVDPDAPIGGLAHRGICTVSACELPHYGRGFCNMHWQRFRRWLKTQAVA